MLVAGLLAAATCLILITYPHLKDKSDEKEAAALADQGASLYKKGEYDRALVKFDQAISLDSENADLFAGRGACNMALEFYRSALMDFSRAISFDQSKWEYFAHRSAANYMLNRIDESLADINQALLLKPDHGACLNTGHRIHRAQGI